MSSAALATGAPAPLQHLRPAAVVVVAVALFAGLPQGFGDAGRLAAVLVVQLFLVAAWVLVTGIEGFLGSLAIGAAAAGAADLVMMLPDRPRLGGLLAVLGVGFLAIVLQQMLRRPRPAVVTSLAGGVLLVCAVCALSVLLLESRSVEGPALGLTGAIAVGAALVAGPLTDLVLPRPRLAPEVPRGLAGLVVAVAVAIGATFLRRTAGGAVLGPLHAIGYGGVLGVVAALVGLAGGYLAVDGDLVGDSDRSAAAAGWALPIVQGVLPLVASVPVALALQTVL